MEKVPLGKNLRNNLTNRPMYINKILNRIIILKYKYLSTYP